MTIIRHPLPRGRPIVEMDGPRPIVMPVETQYTVPGTIRVSARQGRRVPGPIQEVARGEWVSWGTDERFRGNARARQWRYQELSVGICPHATIRVHGDIHVEIYDATNRELELLDPTLALVPPPHLRFLNREKPEGIHMVNFVGQRGGANFSGGLNAGYDLESTPYVESNAILITHTAAYQRSDLGVCPTVLHEIGHVMTHPGGGLAISGAVADEARQQSVSTNEGELEGLCNAYMYFLCYGSEVRRVRAWGSNEADVLSSRRMRAALRGCRAFAGLPEPWPTRLAER
ncbi:MAG: hypothetical protein JXR37_00640 [Kiritimatiellae bacterium]|nr:hypothetical protein [Kiritimatiellia bacterium]